MKLRFGRLVAGLLSLVSLLSVGCGQSNELPPGGAKAVAYWQAVLTQYPDLPEKVQAIVDGQGHVGWLGRYLPQTTVTIHGDGETYQYSGRHVHVVVTDLDQDTLRQLLKWWKEVPRLARELDIQTVLPFALPSSTQHIVVLGKQGKIQIGAPGGYDSQSIQILTDEYRSQTTINVHTFGDVGQQALDQLADQYNRVRGPPDSAVKAGLVSLPPPEDNVTVLVIGQLGSLYIDGPTENASQDISFAGYLNRHESYGDVAGVLAGTPFPVGSSELTSSSEVTAADSQVAPASVEPSESSPGVATSGYDSTPQTAALPQQVTFPGTSQLPTNFELPRTQFPNLQTPGTGHIPTFVPPVQPITTPTFRFN